MTGRPRCSQSGDDDQAESSRHEDGAAVATEDAGRARARHGGISHCQGENLRTSLAQVVAHDTDGGNDAAEDTERQSDEDEQGGRPGDLVDRPAHAHAYEH